MLRFSPQSTHSEHLKLSRKPDIFQLSEDVEKKKGRFFPRGNPPRTKGWHAATRIAPGRLKTATGSLKIPQAGPLPEGGPSRAADRARPPPSYTRGSAGEAPAPQLRRTHRRSPPPALTEGGTPPPSHASGRGHPAGPRPSGRGRRRRPSNPAAPGERSRLRPPLRLPEGGRPPSAPAAHRRARSSPNRRPPASQPAAEPRALRMRAAPPLRPETGRLRAGALGERGGGCVPPTDPSAHVQQYEGRGGASAHCACAGRGRVGAGPLCACVLVPRYVRGEVLEGSRPLPVATKWRERAVVAPVVRAAFCRGCIAACSLGGRSLAGRYGGDSRGGAVSSGVAAGAGSVRGKPGWLEAVSWRGRRWGLGCPPK